MWVVLIQAIVDGHPLDVADVVGPFPSRESAARFASIQQLAHPSLHYEAREVISRRDYLDNLLG
jgi:hypothetical protein